MKFRWGLGGEGGRGDGGGGQQEEASEEQVRIMVVVVRRVVRGKLMITDQEAVKHQRYKTRQILFQDNIYNVPAARAGEGF